MQKPISASQLKRYVIELPSKHLSLHSTLINIGAASDPHLRSFCSGQQLTGPSQKGAVNPQLVGVLTVEHSVLHRASVGSRPTPRQHYGKREQKEGKIWKMEESAVKCCHQVMDTAVALLNSSCPDVSVNSPGSSTDWTQRVMGRTRK